MAAQNIEIRVSSGANFDDVFYPKTITAMVSDLLDANSKIKLSWIPESLLGAPASAGTITTETTASGIMTTLDTWLTNMGYLMDTEQNKQKARMGKYLIAATNKTISADTEHQILYNEQGGTLDESGSLVLENGDRIQYAGYNSGSGFHTWAIINNTYADATTDLKGVLKLATTTATTGDIDVGTDTTKAVTPAGAKRAASVHHPNGGAATGTYHEVTVDSKGHISAGANPTTLAGYGITDAAPLAHVGTRGAAHTNATTSEAGFMASADKSKLDGIAAGANNYSHPAYTERSLDLGTNETIDSLTSDASGHITAATKQTIRAASTSVDGLIQLATAAEAQAGTDTVKALTPSTGKSLVDVFATIKHGATLPAMTTPEERALQPAGKLFLLHV